MKNMNLHPDVKQIASEAEMLQLGRDFAKQILATPDQRAVFELIGDVGAGKTTFARGLAEGLKVQEPVTSPSFTISKRYVFPIPENCCKNYNTSDNIPNSAFDNASDNTYSNTPGSNSNNPTGQLIHYDFYRLDDPGIMRDELAEALAEPNSVIVVEWGSDVADLLPLDKIRLEISLCEDGSRTVKIFSSNPSSNDRPNPIPNAPAQKSIAQTQPAKDQK